MKDYYTGLSKIYFNRILDKIIRLANLKTARGLILDFGCGHSHLFRRTARSNIIGYDIQPQLTQVKDYRIFNPHIIVCCSVLEHLDLTELDVTLKSFMKFSNHKLLITALPTENWVSKIGLLLTNNLNGHQDHKLKLYEVNMLLSKYYTRTRTEKIYTMCEVTTWSKK